jgi:hypothetical protein
MGLIGNTRTLNKYSSFNINWNALLRYFLSYMDLTGDICRYLLWCKASILKADGFLWISEYRSHLFLICTPGLSPGRTWMMRVLLSRLTCFFTQVGDLCISSVTLFNIRRLFYNSEYFYLFKRDLSPYGKIINHIRCIGSFWQEIQPLSLLYWWSQ